MELRSDRVKQGVARAGARSLLYACGVTSGQLERPFIGIADASTNMVPGHLTLRELCRVVENGIKQAAADMGVVLLRCAGHLRRYRDGTLGHVLLAALAGDHRRHR